MLDRQPRALRVKCSHLAGLAEYFALIRTWRLLIEVDMAKDRQDRDPRRGMSNKDVAKETSRHDLDESTTSGTDMETSGQGLVAVFELSAQAVTD